METDPEARGFVQSWYETILSHMHPFHFKFHDFHNNNVLDQVLVLDQILVLDHVLDQREVLQALDIIIETEMANT